METVHVIGVAVKVKIIFLVYIKGKWTLEKQVTIQFRIFNILSALQITEVYQIMILALLLYGCESSSFIVSEIQSLRKLKNRLLMKLFY
jgi:hypothetical protein